MKKGIRVLRRRVETRECVVTRRETNEARYMHEIAGVVGPILYHQRCRHKTSRVYSIKYSQKTRP